MNYFNGKKHRRGAMSIEAAICFPLFILIVLCSMDLAYLFYLKTSVTSRIEVAMEESETRIHEMTNSKFESGNANSKSHSERIKNRLEKTLFDEINSGISGGEIERSIGESIRKKLPITNDNLKIIAIPQKNLFSLSFSVYYDIELQTLFSDIYNKINPKLTRITGTKVFKIRNQFDEIVLIEVVVDILDENTNIGEVAQKIRSAIQKLASYFSTGG